MYLGFNESYFHKNYREAADLVVRASRLPGSPAYLPQLATRLYAASDSFDLASSLATQLAEQAEDPELKDAMERRVFEIRIEQDLRKLETAIAAYRASNGTLPTRLSELQEAGAISRIPTEPDGQAYVYDPTTGEVSSRTFTDRLRPYQPYVRPRQ